MRLKNPIYGSIELDHAELAEIWCQVSGFLLRSVAIFLFILKFFYEFYRFDKMVNTLKMKVDF